MAGYFNDSEVCNRVRNLRVMTVQGNLDMYCWNAKAKYGCVYERWLRAVWRAAACMNAALFQNGARVLSLFSAKTHTMVVPLRDKLEALGQG